MRMSMTLGSGEKTSIDISLRSMIIPAGRVLMCRLNYIEIL